jgi:hypothetical protein
VAGIGPRHVFSESAYFVLANTKDFGDISEGRAGLEGIETTDDGSVFGAVTVKQQAHDIVFAVMREVDVDVWQLLQRHAVAIEEALKIQTLLMPRQ